MDIVVFNCRSQFVTDCLCRVDVELVYDVIMTPRDPE